jgi:hypothetical protein
VGTADGELARRVLAQWLLVLKIHGTSSGEARGRSTREVDVRGR